MSKFGSKKISRAGYSFASKFEATLFDELKDKQIRDEISDLQTQVSVYLTKARILYKPDFSFIVNSPDFGHIAPSLSLNVGDLVFAEAKGFETPVWRIKRRLWMHYGPGPLLVFKGSHKTGSKLYEVISVKNT